MSAPGLRLVFFGTPTFALPTLEALLASRHTVAGVVTQPDRPRGRGHHLSASPVKALAASHGIPVLQPDRLKDPAVLAALAAFDADCGVVAAYGRILPEVVLALPRLGLLNVHASLLPRYRGAAPIQHALMRGERETGVTIMRVVRELDAGPMLARASRPVDPDETSVDVERDLAVMGARLLVDALEQLPALLPGVPQDARLATYAPRITREDGLIDWARPASTLHDQVRALHPWPHAFTFFEGQRLIVRRSRPHPARVSEDETPGRVVTASDGVLRVATREGHLDLTEVQLEGRKPASAREFLAGHRVPAGTVLRAPQPGQA